MRAGLKKVFNESQEKVTAAGADDLTKALSQYFALMKTSLLNLEENGSGFMDPHRVSSYTLEIYTIIERYNILSHHGRLTRHAKSKIQNSNHKRYTIDIYLQDLTPSDKPSCLDRCYALWLDV